MDNDKVVLTNTMIVWQIMEDVLKMFPPKNWMETMAVDSFKARVLGLTEAQCTLLLEKVKARLILTSLAH